MLVASVYEVMNIYDTSTVFVLVLQLSSVKRLFLMGEYCSEIFTVALTWLPKACIPVVQGSFFPYLEPINFWMKSGRYCIVLCIVFLSWFINSKYIIFLYFYEFFRLLRRCTIQIANILIRAMVRDFAFGERSRRNFHSTRLRLVEWKVALSPQAKSCTIALMSIRYLYTVQWPERKKMYVMTDSNTCKVPHDL